LDAHDADHWGCAQASLRGGCDGEQKKRDSRGSSASPDFNRNK
jgi:hypothetical protein